MSVHRSDEVIRPLQRARRWCTFKPSSRTLQTRHQQTSLKMSCLRPLFLLTLSMLLFPLHAVPRSRGISDKALLEELQSLDTLQEVHVPDQGVDEKVDIERMAELLCGEGKPKSRKDDRERKRVRDAMSKRIGPMPLPGWLDSLVGEARQIVWSVGPRMRR